MNNRQKLIDAVQELPVELLPELTSFLEYLKFKAKANTLLNQPDKSLNQIIQEMQEQAKANGLNQKILDEILDNG